MTFSGYRRRLAAPDVSTAITQQLQSIMEKLPSGYHIEEAGSIKEPGKTTFAMLLTFPIMLAALC